MKSVYSRAIGGSTQFETSGLSSRERKCPVCGKTFTPPTNTPFKIRNDKTTRFFCSWTCYRTVQRPMEEAKKRIKEVHDMENSRPTQCERILDYLQEHGSITQIEALNDLGVMRLASRVNELRKRGFEIDGEIIEVKNRYGETCSVKRYTMAKDGGKNGSAENVCQNDH